jgi:PAS domain S-box-containing protein
MQRTDDVGAILGEPHSGIWQEETRSAVAMPVRASLGGPVRGVLVLGISPRLTFDAGYQAFFELVGREIAANLTAGQERLARQEADRERQNLFDFFNQTPAGLHILSGPEHRFLLANESYLELVDREVLGRTVRECFDDDTVERFVPLLDQVLRTGQPFVGNELPLRFPGKPERIVNVSYTPFRNAAGAVRGILGFVYDITAEVTARQRSEQLAAELGTALHARDEFLGIASHELKTPLTSLRLQLQMARRGTPASPDKLLKQADRLARLIDDMLDITRIDAGKMAFHRAPAVLAELVTDVLERFAPQFAAVGSTLSLDLAPGLVGEWDAFRIEQVITNLVTNAVKYAAGKPVHIRAARIDGKAVLTIADHGPGVAQQNRERIFHRFERAISANE